MDVDKTKWEVVQTERMLSSFNTDEFEDFDFQEKNSEVLRGFFKSVVNLLPDQEKEKIIHALRENMDGFIQQVDSDLERLESNFKLYYKQKSFNYLKTKIELWKSI